jgi:dTDP-4-amino-4,6-dideoxygalactose transaminase
MHGVPHIYLCSSGTCAVELALRGLNVGLQDEVALAGYDFPGNFRAIESVGARPVLVDIDRRTWCVDTTQLAGIVQSGLSAVIVSHLHGGIANMQDLVELARQNGIPIVEDACQATGATIQGRTAGAWGDVGVLSFGGSKLLSAGRGGALLTNREEVLQRLKIHCERGNVAYPLSELQAIVLQPQLDRLFDQNAQRRKGVDRLTSLLESCDALRVVDTLDLPCDPSYYKLAWAYDPEACGGRTRGEFIAAVRAEGVAIDRGFRGFTRRGSRRCRRAYPLTASEEAAQTTLLLHHPVLIEPPETVDRIAEAVWKVVRSFRGRS